MTMRRVPLILLGSRQGPSLQHSPMRLTRSKDPI